MSDSPTNITAASQKRPLEDPSSPSGPGEQPDAKRPHLGKDKEGASESRTVTPVAEDVKDIEVDVPESSETSKPQPVPSLPTSDGQNNGYMKHSLPGSGKMPPTSSGNGTQDESMSIHIRAIISSAEAATVIGKGGENVTQIRSASGAKCTVSDYTRGAVERILTVSGLVDAVAKVSPSQDPLL